MMKEFFCPVDETADGVALQLIETFLGEINGVYNNEITERETELLIEPLLQVKIKKLVNRPSQKLQRRVMLLH